MADELNIAEKNVIGGCLNDKDIFFKVNGILSFEDFLEPNKTVFKAMTDLNVEKGVVSDSAALIEFMDSKKLLDKIPGKENYITDIFLNYRPLADEIDYSINIVKDKSSMRQFLTVLKDIQKRYDKEPIDDISSFLANAENSILSVTEKRRVSEFRDPDSVLKSLQNKFQTEADFRKINKITEPYLTGYPTGYDDLDRLCGGFHPSDLMILAARPGVGKTALALNFAQKMAKKGRAIGIFSMEMSSEQILLRILANESKLTTDVISRMSIGEDNGTYSIMDKQSLSDALFMLKSERLFIDDTSSMTVDDILSKARKLKTRYPELSLIIIDYLGLIKSASKSSKISRQEEVSNITRSLKIMARTLNVPVLVLCQLSRGVELRTDHEPNLSDLRDSGSIEQDADMVFFIYRSDYYKTENKEGNKVSQTPSEPQGEFNKDISETKLILSKNRSGKTGEVDLNFYRKYFRFQAVVKQEEYN